MKTEFLLSFYKDLDNINNKKIKVKIIKFIDNCKNANKLSELKSIKKLKGSDIAYSFKIPDYRLGFYYENNTIQFARFLHRKDIYKHFPKK